MTIARPIRDTDLYAWLPLWRGYNTFYRNAASEEVTRATFRRLWENDDGLFGLVAEDDGDLVGLAHAVFHPSTWTTGTCCYLEDLLVSRGDAGRERDAS